MLDFYGHDDVVLGADFSSQRQIHGCQWHRKTMQTNPHVRGVTT